MKQNILVQSTRLLLIDLIGELLYFPIWWYSQGLKRIILYVFASIKNTGRNMAIGILFKNLFKPMFGQYDREGRIISFFFRIIITLGKTLLFLLISIFNLLLIIFWIFLPLAVTWGIFNNFSTLWKV